jgi:hypothetical protein
MPRHQRMDDEWELIQDVFPRGAKCAHFAGVGIAAPKGCVVFALRVLPLAIANLPRANYYSQFSGWPALPLRSLRPAMPAGAVCRERRMNLQPRFSCPVRLG